MSPYNKCDSVGQSVYITDVPLHGGPKDHLIVLSHFTKKHDANKTLIWMHLAEKHSRDTEPHLLP